MTFRGLWRRNDDAHTSLWEQELELHQEEDRITGKLRLLEPAENDSRDVLFETEISGRVAAETGKIYVRTRPLHDALSLYLLERIDDKLRILPMANDNDLAGAWSLAQPRPS